MTSPPFSVRPFLRTARWLMLSGLALSCIATLANFGLLFLSGWFLAAATAAGLGGIATQNMFNMFLPAAGVRFFATIRILARYLERLVTHDMAFRITGHIRAASFAALVPRSVILERQTRSGDVLARLVSDTDQMGQHHLNVTLPRQNALICTVVVVGITALFSPHAALLLSLGLLIGGIGLPALLHILTRTSVHQMAETTEALQGDILENLQGMADILFCGAAQRRIARISARQKTLNRLTFTQALFSHIIQQTLLLLSLGTMLGIVALATQDYQVGALTGPDIPMLALGTLAAFEIIAPLPEAQLAQIRFKRAARRIDTLCSLPVSITENTRHNSNIISIPERYDLDLQDISITLPDAPAGHFLFQNLSLHLQEGEHVALTGPSGVGKTTLMRLIMRLAIADSGHMFFGGVPLEHFTTQDLATRIGVMMQKPHLFHGSLRRNLQIAAPDASENAMLTALETTGLLNDIYAMPEGLDTLCGEQGMRLSGGQIRRFAAAQILLRRPSLLILDEPTESLPSATGTTMLANMLAALPHASVLCITHRPEPLAFMQRVLHLENGQLLHRLHKRKS